MKPSSGSAAMEFLNPISQLIKKTWIIWFAVIVALGAIWTIYDPLRHWIDVELEKQIIVRSAGRPTITAWPSHLIAAGIFFGLFLVFAAGLMALTLRRGSARRAERETLLKTFRQSMQATDLICAQLFPTAAAPVKKVLSFKQVFTFYADGDCHCLQEITITSAARDVHFYEMEIAGDPEALPASFPEDIQLQVAAASGQSLTYLISINEPIKKRLVIFFLPFIQASTTDQRGVTATYYWPGLMRRLFTRGNEEFLDQIRSADPVPEVEYEFWMKPRAGRLNCTQIGKKLVGEKLERTGPNANGMTGWVYHASNVPVNHETKLRLELS